MARLPRVRRAGAEQPRRELVLTEPEYGLVFGQPDFTHTNCGTTATTLCFPDDLAVDASGNLYVSDSDNGRVVRYTPSP